MKGTKMKNKDVAKVDDLQSQYSIIKAFMTSDNVQSRTKQDDLFSDDNEILNFKAKMHPKEPFQTSYSILNTKDGYNKNHISSIDTGTKYPIKANRNLSKGKRESYESTRKSKIVNILKRNYSRPEITKERVKTQHGMNKYNEDLYAPTSRPNLKSSS